MFKAFKNKGAKRRDLTLEDLQRRQDEAADEDMEAQLKADIEEALKPLEKELTNDDKGMRAAPSYYQVCINMTGSFLDKSG